METRDKTEILDALRRGKSPGPGRWSALECAEHVAVSEDFLFSQLIEARPAGVPLVNHQEKLDPGARRGSHPPRRSPEVVAR